MVNRLRQLFWGYYPQLNEVAGKVFHPWLLELWELAPTPAAARRIRKSSVQKISRTTGYGVSQPKELSRFSAQRK